MGLGLFGVPWQITSEDPEVQIKIKPSQPPDGGATWGNEPTISSSSGVGSVPAVQWLSPGVRSVKIAAVINAATIFTDLKPIRDQFAQLTAIAPMLGRAPLVTLQWGDDSITGFVKSAPQHVVQYWATGQVQIVEIAIEVIEVIPTSIEGVGASGETLRISLAEGETFESLAGRYLRDPLKGDLIRGINPRVARDRETAGTRVRVFERSHPEMRAPVTPHSPCFLTMSDGSTPWKALVEELGADRGDGRGLPVRLLPELVGV